MLSRILVLMSLTVFSLTAGAGELTADKIMLKYIDGLEGGLRVALEKSENISPSQLLHLNQTVLRTSIKGNVLETVAEELFSQQIARGADVRELIRSNPEMIVKELDKSISIVIQRFELYHQDVVNSKVIGFRKSKMTDSEVTKVKQIIKKINKARDIERLPEINREIMSSPLIKTITDINYHNSRARSISGRLTARLGNGFAERLLNGLGKAL